MDDAAPTLPPRRSSRWRQAHEWLAFGIVAATVAGLGGYQLKRNHDWIEQQERNRLQTQAQVVEDNLQRQLIGASSALSGVRYDVATGDADESMRLSWFRLKVLSDAMTGAREIAVYDAQGDIVATDRRGGQAPSNVADADFFRIPRARQDYTMLHVSPPFRAADGAYSIHLSKSYASAAGSFGGVVTVALDPRFFEAVAASVLYAPDMVVGIAHGDGVLFATAPRNEAAIGRALGDGASLLARHLGSGARHSVQQGVTLLNDEQRLIAFRTVEPASLGMDRPLVVAVGRRVRDVFAPWHKDVLFNAGLFVLLSASSALALRFSQQRRRAVRDAAHERALAEKDNALRLELGLRGADLGLWDWVIETDALTVNARELQMLGFAEGGIALTGREWQKRIHPQDWLAVKDVFLHEAGVRGTYTFEHRMQHRDGHWIWVLSHSTVMRRDAQGRPARVLGTHLDISARKAADARLQAAADLQRRTGELARVGGWEFDLAERRLHWTAQMYRIHARDADSGPPSLRAWLAMFRPEGQLGIRETLREAVLHGVPWNLELEMTTAQGERVWVRTQGERLVQADGAARLVGAFQDITQRVRFEAELRAANEQLARMSMTDGLTGVGNRRLFDASLQAEWARAARQAQPLALLMVDVDYFKAYNDRHGHHGGDAVLRRVARLLQACVRRSGELVARYGGEEFAILLPASELPAALDTARSCMAAVAEAAIAHGGSPVSTVLSLSIGVTSLVPQPGEDAERLLHAADAALYEAKRQGRNRVQAAGRAPAAS